MADMIVRPTSKGQVTLPKKIREAIGISAGSPLGVELGKGVVILRPVVIRPKRDVREYADQEIERFVAEDRLDRETARWVKKVLEG